MRLLSRSEASIERRADRRTFVSLSEPNWTQHRFAESLRRGRGAGLDQGGGARRAEEAPVREVRLVTFSAYSLRGKMKVSFRSAPTARSPRAANHDSRLAEKFVDFKTFLSQQVESRHRQ